MSAYSKTREAFQRKVQVYNISSRIIPSLPSPSFSHSLAAYLSVLCLCSLREVTQSGILFVRRISFLCVSPLSCCNCFPFPLLSSLSWISTMQRILLTNLRTSLMRPRFRSITESLRSTSTVRFFFPLLLSLLQHSHIVTFKDGQAHHG